MRSGRRHGRSFLAAFTAGQGYADDAAYSARAWLIHQTQVTSGAAVGPHGVGQADPHASASRWRLWLPGRSRSRSAD